MSYRTALITPAAAALLAATGLSVFPAHADSQAGLRVARDPVTGELRAPTAEESKALEAKTPRGAARAPVGLLTGKVNPQAIVHPDGTVQQELTDDTMTYSVARRAADGSIEMFCVTGSQAADLAVKSKKPAAKAAQEHQHVK